LALADVSAVAAIITDMFCSVDVDELSRASVFLLDAAFSDVQPDFRDALPRAELPAALAAGIAADNYALRRPCITTTGRLGVMENLPGLVGSLPRCAFDAEWQPS
jgi:hypothetical protein